MPPPQGSADNAGHPYLVAAVAEGTVASDSADRPTQGWQLATCHEPLCCHGNTAEVCAAPVADTGGNGKQLTVAGGDNTGTVPIFALLPRGWTGGTLPAPLHRPPGSNSAAKACLVDLARAVIGHVGSCHRCSVPPSARTTSASQDSG